MVLINDLKSNEYNLEAYINIIKNSPIGICITDEEGYFEYVNPKYCELYNYSKEELLGKHFSLVTNSKSKNQLINLHDQFIAGEDEVEGEWNVVDKEGNRLVILANAAKIFGKDGQAKKVTYVIDITEKKKFEKELKDKNIKLEESNEEIKAINECLQERNEEIKAMNEELKEKQQEIINKNKKMNQNIAKAKQLHKSLLPKDLPKINNLDIAAYYNPAQELGGDFYNLIETEEYFLFYVVDITGHGIDGALLNVFVRETINSFLHSKAKKTLSSAEIIEFLAQKYREEEFPDDYFLCIMLGIINKETMELTHSNAGIHIPPLFSTSNKSVSSLTATSLPISTAFDINTLEIKEETIQLNNNNALLITTDGIIEEVQNNKLYGRDRLAWIFKQNSNLAAKEIIDTIKKDFKNFTGELASKDDITILIIKLRDN